MTKILLHYLFSSRHLTTQVPTLNRRGAIHLPMKRRLGFAGQPFQHQSLTSDALFSLLQYFFI